MKLRLFSLVFFCWLIPNASKSQENEKKKEPLFSLLSEIKTIGEFKYRNILKEQELALDTLSDEAKGKMIKEQQRFAYYQRNSACREAYYILKLYVDKLVSQLKADLTISNKKKLIKRLNSGTIDSTSWYYEAIKNVQDAKADLLKCNIPGMSGPSVSDVTGIFSAVTDVLISTRDFRAQQIKALCEQLDAFKLADIDSDEVTKKTDDKKSE